MTREDWEVVKLGNVCDINSKNIWRNFLHDLILYIDISSVSTWFMDKPKLIKKDEAPSRAKRIISDWDIILSTVRPNRRQFVYIKKSSSNLIASTWFAVLSSKNNVDWRYIYLIISSEDFTNYLVSNEKWSAYPAVDIETISNYEISLPPLAEQQRIASILSAYDDLIENNTRRIALLEQMAQTLYRQWFVEYKFPWYQDVEMVESGTEFGMIPKGREVKKIGEIVKPTQWMQVPVWEQFTIKEEWYVQFLRIVDYTQANTDIRYIKNPWTKCFVDIDEIAMIRYWEVWLVWRWRQGIIANNLFKINPLNTERDIKPYIYYFFLQKEVKEWLVQKQNSSTLPSITFEMFNNIALIIPSNDVIKKFNILDNSYFKETINLQKQNQYLKEQRDLLLRKLIG